MWSQIIKKLYESGGESTLLRLSHSLPIGTNIYDLDWDLLLVLDACRPDALAQVQDEYSFIEDVSEYCSVGSATREWLANTFVSDYADSVSETTYVMANGNVKFLDEPSPCLHDSSAISRRYSWDYVDSAMFDRVVRVWEHTDGDRITGIPVPETVTNCAITEAREHDPTRLIVHYCQPHAPYVSRALAQDRDLKPAERDPWSALRNGGDRKSIWDSYLDDLRWVLNSIETLLENIDRDRVVVTADHGEAFGEHRLYSHPAGVPHPILRRVPLVRTQARDSETRESTWTRESEGTDIEKQLDALGYT